MAVTKADLALTLFEEVGLNKREATECVEAFEVIPIEARRVVTYRPSQKLKKTIDDNADFLCTTLIKDK